MFFTKNEEYLCAKHLEGVIYARLPLNTSLATPIGKHPRGLPWTNWDLLHLRYGVVPPWSGDIKPINGY